ncbi:Cof-like hydrolase [uncultured Paludibacter sp.]|uniref:Cof-like hydrolase n=1 Tax=uncultured Paludibacter sp. TaxID=497635 RepID=A0A653A5R7_9BACT|nr:Cof-like hydrolase [uncultured Paludibacter sp.]
MIKAIFFDIDGTLKSFETHQIPESTMYALEELQKKGIKIFIATGRTPDALKSFDLQVDGYITLNGGYCYLSTGEIIYKHTVSKNDIQALMEYQKTNPTPCVVMAENITFATFKHEKIEHFIELLNFPRMEIFPLEKALEVDVLQIVLFISEKQDDDMLKILKNCDALRWYPTFADFVPKGSHKGIGIDKIIEHFGISLSETMAFGDGGNDISMLQHAAIGVAMGNATEEVKRAADYVTDTVDNDGVYKALKAFSVL